MTLLSDQLDDTQSILEKDKVNGHDISGDTTVILMTDIKKKVLDFPEDEL